MLITIGLALSIIVAALILGLVSLTCTQIPLLNYLGYEFSAIIGVVASFVAAFLTIREVRLATTTPKERLTRALKTGLVLLIIPLVVMMTNALFVKNCSIVEGLAFFALIPVVSVWFSVCLGFFCGMHYRFARTAFSLFFVVTLLYALGLGYFTPAIFSYNFFYGFFPGFTYDEALGLSTSLVMFRVWTIVVGGIFLWMGFLLSAGTTREETTVARGIALLKAMISRPQRIITVSCAGMIALMWWFSGHLGFESRAGYIREVLGAVYTSEHFTIYYAPESYTDEEIRGVAEEHELRLHQVLTALSLPSISGIESYLYPTNTIKQRLIGTSTTNIAKPWSGQIHLTASTLDASLKHELAHVAAARFGRPVIRASFSTGLVEGLAMAIEWNWGNKTLHEYAAAMRRYGVGPDVKDILSFTGFATQSSSVSYVLAGSFCRFLIDRYGIRRMMLLYRSDDYEAVYGRPLDSLIAEWGVFLDGIPEQENDRDAIEVLFRRPAIFGKTCARVLARQNADAAALFKAGDYRAAADLYHRSYVQGKGYAALAGYVTSKLYGQNYTGVLVAFDSVIRADERPAQFLPLYPSAGLAYWASGEHGRARDVFRRVAFADLSRDLTEAALLYTHALDDSVNRDALLSYFHTSLPDSLRLTHLREMKHDPDKQWIPMYLAGRVLARMGKNAEALAIFSQLDLSEIEPRLEARRRIAAGTSLYALRSFADARGLFWSSLNFVATAASHIEVNDWLDRAEWMLARQRLEAE